MTRLIVTAAFVFFVVAAAFNARPVDAGVIDAELLGPWGVWYDLPANDAEILRFRVNALEEAADLEVVSLTILGIGAEDISAIRLELVSTGEEVAFTDQFFPSSGSATLELDEPLALEVGEPVDLLVRANLDNVAPPGLTASLQNLQTNPWQEHPALPLTGPTIPFGGDPPPAAIEVLESPRFDQELHADEARSVVFQCQVSANVQEVVTALTFQLEGDTPISDFLADVELLVGDKPVDLALIDVDPFILRLVPGASALPLVPGPPLSISLTGVVDDDTDDVSFALVNLELLGGTLVQGLPVDEDLAVTGQPTVGIVSLDPTDPGVIFGGDDPVTLGTFGLNPGDGQGQWRLSWLDVALTGTIHPDAIERVEIWLPGEGDPVRVGASAMYDGRTTIVLGTDTWHLGPATVTFELRASIRPDYPGVIGLRIGGCGIAFGGAEQAWHRAYHDTALHTAFFDGLYVHRSADPQPESRTTTPGATLEPVLALDVQGFGTGGSLGALDMTAIAGLPEEVDALHVTIDHDGDAEHDPATEPVIGTGYYTPAGATQIALEPALPLGDGESVRLLVLMDLSESARHAADFATSVVDAVAVEGESVTLPTDSATLTVIETPGQLLVVSTPDTADQPWEGGTAPAVLARLQLNTPDGGTTLENLSLQAEGTGNDALAIAQVQVVHDLNGNGLLDPTDEPGGDRLLGTGNYLADDGLLQLACDLALAPGGGATLLVVYQFADGVTNGSFGARVLQIETVEATAVQGLPLSTGKLLPTATDDDDDDEFEPGEDPDSLVIAAFGGGCVAGTGTPAPPLAGLLGLLLIGLVVRRRAA